MKLLTLRDVVQRPDRVGSGTGRKADWDDPDIAEAYQKRFTIAQRKKVAEWEKDLPSLRLQEYLLGIEIEIEGISVVTGNIPFELKPFWFIKGDGSLRNGGLEYVTAPFYSEELPRQLAILMLHAEQWATRAEYSWRTSTHVHVDVANMPVDHFKKFLLLYMIFENSLFTYANPGRRETNIFCTPLTRLNLHGFSQFIAAEKRVEYVQALSSIMNSVHKYSAVNFLHLNDFGTLEFRHLRGTGDYEFLTRWIELLLQLIASAESLPFQRLHSIALALNSNSEYRQFADEVFGPSISRRLLTNHFNAEMSRGVTTAKELLRGQFTERELVVRAGSGIVKFADKEGQRAKKDPLENRRLRKLNDRQIQMAAAVDQLLRDAPRVRGITTVVTDAWLRAQNDTGGQALNDREVIEW